MLPVALGVAFGAFSGCFQAGSFVVRREIFVGIGGYEGSLRYGENTELAFRITSFCSAEGWAIEPISKVLFSWHQDPLKQARSTVRHRLHAAVLTVERHGERLRRDPVLFASQFAIAGRCAFELRDFRAARKYFRAAATRTPRNARYVAWFAIAAIRSLLPNSTPPESG